VTAAGALLAVQTRVGSALGVEMGSPLAASTVSFLVAVVLLALVVVVRERAAVRRLRTASTRWWYWIGGLSGAYSASMMVVAGPRVGVAVASVGSCTGMALGALGADRAGFGPAGRHRVTGRRLIGAALAVAAVAVAAGPAAGDGQLLLLALLVLAGVGAAFQQPVNGRLGLVAGGAFVPALVSFIVGLVALGALLLLVPQDVSWPAAPWLYTGGLLAAVYITCSLVAVRRLGVLPLMLATVGGQLSGAAALDAVVPLPGRSLTAGAVAGALLALCAVALAARRAP
jgi:transporter family-2 protein